jgi:hypothetical protein
VGGLGFYDQPCVLKCALAGPYSHALLVSFVLSNLGDNLFIKMVDRVFSRTMHEWQYRFGSCACLIIQIKSILTYDCVSVWADTISMTSTEQIITLQISTSLWTQLTI